MIGNKFIQVNDDGELESLDLDTGVLTPVESSEEKALQSALGPASYKVVKQSNGRLVYVPEGCSAASIRDIAGKNYTMPYSRLLALQVCEGIANGKTLYSISQAPGFPNYSTIGQWRREHPEFNEWFGLAKMDSAGVYFDKLMEAADCDDDDKDAIALKKLKADIYKHAAKVASPDEYGDKKKVEIESTSTVFIVETGIRRAGDDGYDVNSIIDITKEIEGDNGDS